MILITQCLCPSRHCVVGLAVEDRSPEEAEATLRELFDAAVKAKQLNRRCGLCGSTDLHFETGKCRFATMEEARPELARLQHEQEETRRYLMAAGQAMTHGKTELYHCVSVVLIAASAIVALCLWLGDHRAAAAWLAAHDVAAFAAGVVIAALALGGASLLTAIIRWGDGRHGQN